MCNPGPTIYFNAAAVIDRLVDPLFHWTANVLAEAKMHVDQNISVQYFGTFYKNDYFHSAILKLHIFWVEQNRLDVVLAKKQNLVNVNHPDYDIT